MHNTLFVASLSLKRRIKDNQKIILKCGCNGFVPCHTRTQIANN